MTPENHPLIIRKGFSTVSIETEHALPNWPVVNFRKDELKRGLFSSPSSGASRLGN